MGRFILLQSLLRECSFEIVFYVAHCGEYGVDWSISQVQFIKVRKFNPKINEFINYKLRNRRIYF